MGAIASVDDALDRLFEATFARELAYVCQSARRLGVREGDVEDVAHDTFVAAYRGLSNYDAARPIRPWLFGIVFRVVSEHRRRLRRQGELIAAREPVDATPSAEARLVAEEERQLVRDAIESIDLSRRGVFVLHELDDVSMPEIAEALGIPLNTAYSRLRLARREFAEHAARARRKAKGP